MEKSLLERVWSGLVGFSRRLADGVAQLTNWQFILLGLLALIGANLLANILDSRPGKQPAPPVAVIIHKEETLPRDTEAAPAVPELPLPPHAAQEESLKQEILKEVQKEVDSASSAPDQTNAKKPNRSADELAADYRKRFGEYRKPDRGLPLGQIVFFLLIILLAVRIATRSRLRADKRVMSAESSAEMESLRRQVTEAQLQTLQAQVEPHFLFNTLAAVEHLTETDPPRASAMLQHLIAFLRGSLPNMRELNTSLGREVDLCRSYLAIMQIRMEDRLKISIDVPEALRGLSFPPMMLQSLVENSIKHGLEPKPEGGAIALSARLQDG
ncbi:MAG: histidine kinase, partial [Sterolibacterium sp.]